MKRVHYISAAIFLLALSACLVGAAQTGDGDEVSRQNDNIRRSKEHLAEIEALVKENQKELFSSEQGLRLVHNRIEARQRIVSGLDAETRRLTAEINSGVRQTRRLDSTLTALKADYGSMVRQAWKNRKMTDATAFLLASKDFNDATRRLYHIRRYNRAQREKGIEIYLLAGEFEARIEAMNLKKTETAALKAESSATLASLAADRTAYEDAQKRLRADRKKLDDEAKKERERIASAQREIDRIMAAQATARNEVLSRADIALSGRFEENKGRLPWPVGGPGTVVDKFGIERAADGIEKNSKGILIAARPDAPVKAVFEGSVSAIWGIPHFDKVVAVRSGNYIMLYGNIARTNLKNGDRIALGQTIGTLSGLGSKAGNYTLLFQIWREKTALNPEDWLRK